MKFAIQITNNSELRFWGIWTSCLLGVVLIFLNTLSIAPFLHKDEFMIVDLGRIILNPHTDWAITWLTKENHPVFLWSYLGPVFQEYSFQLLGELGPRISGLLGAVAASTALVYHLLVRGTIQIAALILGLAMLLDPLFVQSYTMGRVDGWAMFFCICSCSLLLPVAGSEKTPFKFILAGAYPIIAFFVWPSAIFLFPLIFVHLINVFSETKRPIKVVFYFALGGLLAFVTILLPISSRLVQEFQAVVNAFIINLQSERANEGPVYSNLTDSFLELLRLLKFTPVLFLTAIVVFVFKRDNYLVIAFLGATSLIVLTLVYVHRVQYLLPYLVLVASGVFKQSAFTSCATHSWRLKSFLVALLIWPVALSMGFRSVVAAQGRMEKERRLVLKAATEMIGPGNHAVLATNEFYYSGRALGWKMFSPYLSVGEPISVQDMKSILPRISYVIIHSYGVSKAFEEEFRNHGFEKITNYSLYRSSETASSHVHKTVNRLRSLYSIFPRPYGPYFLYRKNRRYNATAASAE